MLRVCAAQPQAAVTGEHRNLTQALPGQAAAEAALVGTMRREGDYFDGRAAGIVDVGENRGVLEKAPARLARVQERAGRLRDRMVGTAVAFVQQRYFQGFARRVRRPAAQIAHGRGRRTGPGKGQTVLTGKGIPRYAFEPFTLRQISGYLI